MIMVHIAIDLQDESEIARVLSLLNQEHVPHRVERKNVLSEDERAAARERMMRGAPTLNVDEMIADNDNSQPYRTPVIPSKVLTDEQRVAARESIMRGSPTLDIDAMLEHLRESRQDRRMPFRDDE